MPRHVFLASICSAKDAIKPIQGEKSLTILPSCKPCSLSDNQPSRICPGCGKICNNGMNILGCNQQPTNSI